MVSEFQPLQQSDFNALAVQANGKLTLPGIPYNFKSPQNPFGSSTPTIWTELARLRSNLYSQFTLFNTPTSFSDVWFYAGTYPFRPTLISSSFFSYINIGTPFQQLSTFALDVTEGITSPAVDRVIGQVPTWANEKWVYTRTTGKVNTRMVLSEFGLSQLVTPLTAFNCSGLTPCPLNAVATIKVGGISGELYNLPFRICGVSEGKVYQGGSIIAGTGNYFYLGSSDTESHLSDSSFNWARLRISDPPQDIYLNNIDGGFGTGGRPVSIDKNLTISVRGGATVTLEFNSVDSQELNNNTGATISDFPIVTGPSSCPINGQFWRVLFPQPGNIGEYIEYFHDFPPERFYVWNDPAKNPSLPFKFKLRFNGKTFQTTFQVNWLARSRSTSSIDTLEMFGANAGDCTLTKVYDGIVGGVAQWHGSIICNASYSADMTFEVGIRDSTQSTTQKLDYIEKAAIPETHSTLKKQICYFERDDTNSVPFNVLDPYTDGSAITPPNFSTLAALPWQADSKDEWISPATHAYPNTLFTGNQARITMTPSNANNDFAQSGFWYLQSYPLANKYFYEAYDDPDYPNRGLNRGTIDESDGYEALQPGFPKASPHAGDSVAPTYPWSQIALPVNGYYTWSLLDPVTHQPIDGGYHFQGGLITSVTIRRRPIKNAKGVYIDSDASQALLVRLGRSFVNAEFYRDFFTVTIPAGQQSITIFPTIAIQAVYPESGYKLELLAISSSPVDVTAKFQAPLINSTGNVLTPTTGTDLPYFNNFYTESIEVTQPGLFANGAIGASGFHLADYFNDVQALLSVIP